MQEPELLQKQRQNLRLFRQAAASREQAQKALTNNHALEKTQADNIQENAQSKAGNLQEKAHYAYMSAKDEVRKIELRGLDAILPLLVGVPANPLPQRPNNDPAIELDHAVSLTTSLSAQLWTSSDSYKAWQVRQQERKYKMIGVATLIAVAMLVGGYLFYGAWSKYNSANSALEAGEWEEARRLFTELGDYQDSQTLLKDADDQLTQIALEAGEWGRAVSLSGNSPQELLHLSCPPPSESSLGDTWDRCSDGMTMVYVPAGSFMMGSMGGMSDERPEHEVILTSFWLDRTEVTNKMYEQCVAAGRCRISRHATDSSFNGESQPVAGVSWDDANAYCDWVGGKLPTEAQWEYSARGPDGNIYPWGDYQPNKDLANYDRSVGKTTDVGSYPAGASWVGAVDMAGNALEWVADWYSDTYYANAPLDNPPGPESGTIKMVRGGSWHNNWRYLRAANRFIFSPALEHYGIGVRCVSAPRK